MYMYTNENSAKKNSYGFFGFVFKEISIIYNFKFWAQGYFFLDSFYILFKSKKGIAASPGGVKTRESENLN